MRAKAFSRYIGWFLSVALLGYVFSKIEWHEFLKSLAEISVFEVAGLIAIYLFGFVLRGLRSQVLLPTLSMSQGFGGVLLGYAANNVLPARLGELVRAQVVGKSAGIKRSTTLSSIVVERILDGFAVVILLLVGSSGLTLPPFAEKARMLGLIVFGAGFLGVLLTGRLYSVFSKHIPVGKIGEIFHGLAQGAELATRDVKTVILTLIYSLAIWSVESLMFAYGFLVFKINATFLSGFFVMGIVNLGVLIPSSPGNVGVFQYFCLKALEAFQVPASQATAYAVVVHMCQYLPVIVLGFLLLPRFGLKSFSEASE